MLPPCGCCQRAWRSAVLQGSADSISTRILLPPRLGTRIGITREQLSLPLASPPSPSGIRGILWVVQSIDLWLVSRSLNDDHEVQRSPPRWPLRKASRPRRTHGAGSLGYGTGPSFG
ncbi:hypothetical protein EMIHUDRAFT_308920 [Emiliania huxleyi CCMP1516]|uniref:Uncharacterized protein n=2 Tax=Emiliania huxleyi TaxID=2903 RepID=A0A0D3I7N5_EMIH1|nr:hypothetical protein EMIHUDRAFT_308920 [Emiliania huxleyi CCMP1516]EOD07270.1 hypothetical protein EMIHUDRAFT_308920 [Emiliania huxleyi CCMP1516]|eukprot:XP_005759699.1 hypothetical protein EMIHUDRAFT_308920 [Emiliania huxleyi CCMP1516]